MGRWDRIGRAAAYGAAALVPYLVIKVSWVVGSLPGLLPVGRGFSLDGWLVHPAVRGPQRPRELGFGERQFWRLRRLRGRRGDARLGIGAAAVQQPS
ncbi:hypothetical protein [Streptomyces sp. NPDC002386]